MRKRDVVFAVSLAMVACGCVSNGEGSEAEMAPAAPSQSEIERGGVAFVEGKCFKCHGNDGRGTPRGPDLTDSRWEHCDGSVDGILVVLERGVPKAELKDPTRPFAMNPASTLVPDAEARRALAAYVWSLSQGTGG